MKQILWTIFGCLLLTIAYANNGGSDEKNSGIQVTYVQKTRFGDVSLVGTYAMPADTIMLNGKKVFADPGMYVSIFGYYPLVDSDVILLESNPGGSGTPESKMSFLVIKRNDFTSVLSHPKFIGAFHDAIQVAIDRDKRIYVKLGFQIEVGSSRGQTEPVAVFDSGKLIMKSLSRIHGDYKAVPTKLISDYFADDRWVALRKSFYNFDRSQRVEYFCDDLDLRNDLYGGESKEGHVFCAAALFLNQSDQWIFQKQFEMPWGGSVREFSGHELIVESVEYSKNDLFGYPTKHITHVFITSTGKLVEDQAAVAHGRSRR